MKTTRDFKKFMLETFTGIFILTNIVPITYVKAASDTIVSPLKTVAKLDCRFQDFEDLSSSCKETLPVLETENYKKYATLNWGYNDYTRRYTVLFLASYKYGWDVWYGWHEWVDIATSKWTPVYSMADWVVIVSKNDLSWWNVITVEHTIRGKKVYSNYAHLSKRNVSVGTKVTAWEQIWEVGSTWDSTGNHLHFQIDLDTPFHPYYPSYTSCPYSYYDITENAKCIEDEKNNLIDPLLFLETKGKVLDNVKVSTTTVSRTTINSLSSSVSKTTSSDEDLSIFDRTVYIGYSSADIKKVQEIFRDIWEYKGEISGNYEDVEKSIISYQLSNNIISSKDDYGAGRFGPKTREQAKNDYKNYLASNPSKKSNSSSSSTTVVVENDTTVEKISRENILSRAEIEAREIEDFLRFHNFDASLEKLWWNLSVWSIIKLDIDIAKKLKDKPFKWNTPLDITFDYDDKVISVFPTKIYNFTDWNREVKITWLKEGNTTIKIKMWSKVLKTINLKVYKSWQAIYPDKWYVFASKNIVLWDTKKAIVLFKDDTNQNLLNLRYGSTFTLRWLWDTEVCIKSGNINNLKNTFNKDCKEEDFVKEVEFSYDDTVWWLVVFDYKVNWFEWKFEIVNNYNNKVLWEKKLVVQAPKGLNKTYTYYDDVVSLLQEDVVDWIKKWYFLEDRWLTESDAISWITNALEKLKDETIDPNMKSEIEKRLVQISKENVSKFNTVTRSEFLDMTFKYLAFDNIDYSNYKEYRDLEWDQNKKVAIVFDEVSTWNDKFGENYFRPDLELTRWEWAYFLNQIIWKQRKLYLVNR